MRKVKKLLVIVLATTMLFGSTLSVDAASKKCPNCGSTTAVTDKVYGFCHHVTYCHAPVIFYACANCKHYWEICTANHVQ